MQEFITEKGENITVTEFKSNLTFHNFKIFLNDT